MGAQKIVQKINQTFYKPIHKAAAMRLVDDVMKIKNIDTIHRARRDLQEYGVTLKGKTAQCIVNMTIMALKLRGQDLGAERYASLETHPVTDHAFIRYVERVHGVDIKALKDTVLEEHKTQDKVVAVWRGGGIVTFLPANNYK